MFDLGGIRSIIGRIVYPPDKGLYRVPEAGLLPVQFGDDLDRLGGNPELLTGLSQGAVKQAAIAAFERPGGQADLAGVGVRFTLRALHQHDPGPVLVLDDGDENRELLLSHGWEGK
ncbi:MAG: hypothetical protein MK138_15025, partial [Planctomycetes bacterium]|nr:hypothetical protein [Planctomycetota bacterium]